MKNKTEVRGRTSQRRGVRAPTTLVTSAASVILLAGCGESLPDGITSPSGKPIDGWVNIETDKELKVDSHSFNLWSACDGPVEVILNRDADTVMVRKSVLCSGYTNPVQGTHDRWVNHDIFNEMFSIRCVQGDMWYFKDSYEGGTTAVNSDDPRCAK